MSGSPLQIAIVDSDTGLLPVLSKRMAELDWRHRALGSAVPADDLIAMRLNAIVIDVAILGHHAWTYLETLVDRLPALGVIVCTGRSSVAQRVRGLRVGVDDWVTKPCHPEELLARVEAVVRPRKLAETASVQTTRVVGQIEIRRDQFQAFVGDASIDLTRREFELIEMLAAAEGQVIPREEIYQRVWGYTMVRGDRSVDVYVRKLRLKLERASPGWRYIHTHFGIGYRFAPEPVGGQAGAATRAGAAAPQPTIASRT